MNIEYRIFSELTPVQQAEVALWVSDYTQGMTGELPQMIPVTQEEVRNKYLGCVAFADDNFAGYISASYPEAWNGQAMSELGTLWVPKTYQKQGIGGGLVGFAAVELIEESITPYGFCNQFSLSLFVKKDFVVADASAIPPSALTLCAKCPAKPSAGCCDTIVVFGGKNA